MKIVYVGRHDKGENDNEGAITYALKSLGHKVIRFHPRDSTTPFRINKLEDCDFVLFNNWKPDLTDFKRIKFPKIFWYFDLVNYSDKSLKRRNQNRTEWMQTMIPLVDLGFCTDGDWVNQDTSGKLVKLTQGADIRSMELLPSRVDYTLPPIIFTGGIDGGNLRRQFCMEMQASYGDAFQIITDRFRAPLAKTFAQTMIAVAPDHPVTDNYYSNRVYITLSYGGFLLHPFSKALLQEYTPGHDLVCYNNRQELRELIGYYLDNDQERDKIRSQGYTTTLNKHTYTHRCQKLIEIVKERLFS